MVDSSVVSEFQGFRVKETQRGSGDSGFGELRFEKSFLPTRDEGSVSGIGPAFAGCSVLSGSVHSNIHQDHPIYQFQQCANPSFQLGIREKKSF